jgi:hypothetical protein
MKYELGSVPVCIERQPRNVAKHRKGSFLKASTGEVPAWIGRLVFVEAGRLHYR